MTCKSDLILSTMDGVQEWNFTVYEAFLCSACHSRANLTPNRFSSSVISGVRFRWPSQDLAAKTCKFK